uniref:retention module-containing protein n=2 Tax=Vibrio TaxID=662 RepID=UPI00188A4723
MDLHVVVQPALVQEVVGDVIAADAKGNARKVSAGDQLNKDEILITVNHSSVTILFNGQATVVDQNCITCFSNASPDSESSVDLVQFPIEGEINADLSLLDEVSFDADNIAAIQQAILDG